MKSGLNCIQGQLGKEVTEGQPDFQEQDSEGQGGEGIRVPTGLQLVLAASARAAPGHAGAV